ncbi:MAG: DUF1573 domain-containing protein [Bacteroidota bacterium]
MKSILSLFFLAGLLSLTSLQAQEVKAMKTTQSSSLLAQHLDDDLGIAWDTRQHDYGQIPQGIPAEAVFTLTNTGKEALLLTQVKGSCGCTATAHDQEPVLPGQSTTITATYNAKKAGAFTKSVKVTTNRSETPIVLQIKGEVVKSE